MEIFLRIFEKFTGIFHRIFAGFRTLMRNQKIFRSTAVFLYFSVVFYRIFSEEMFLGEGEGKNSLLK